MGGGVGVGGQQGGGGGMGVQQGWGMVGQEGWGVAGQEGWGMVGGGALQRGLPAFAGWGELHTMIPNHKPRMIDPNTITPHPIHLKQSTANRGHSTRATQQARSRAQCCPI